MPYILILFLISSTVFYVKFDDTYDDNDDDDETPFEIVDENTYGVTDCVGLDTLNITIRMELKLKKPFNGRHNRFTGLIGIGLPKSDANSSRNIYYISVNNKTVFIRISTRYQGYSTYYLHATNMPFLFDEKWHSLTLKIYTLSTIMTLSIDDEYSKSLTFPKYMAQPMGDCSTAHIGGIPDGYSTRGEFRNIYFGNIFKTINKSAL